MKKLKKQSKFIMETKDIEMLNRGFEIIENNATGFDLRSYNRQLNNLIRLYFEKVTGAKNDAYDFTDFDKKQDLENAKELTLINVVYEKALMVCKLGFCLNIEKDIEWETEYKMIKAIPFLEKLIKYKMEKYGNKILGDMGLEIKGRTSDGGVITQQKENATAEEIQKGEEMFKDLKKSGDVIILSDNTDGKIN